MPIQEVYQDIRVNKKIYLIKNSEDDTYKIGVAKNPIKRLKQLQTGNSAELLLIYTYETKLANKIEKILHNQYSYLKKHGEWFLFSILEENAFIENCKKIEENIIFLQESNNVFA